MPTEISLTDGTAAALAEVEGFADRFVTQMALEIEARAKGGAAVETGAMQASVAAITPMFSHYADAVAEAESLNPDATFADELSIGEHEAVVQVPIDYAAFLEFGTTRAPAQPFLTPAAEAVAADAEGIAKRVAGRE